MHNPRKHKVAMDRHEILTVVRGMIYEAERELLKRLEQAVQYMATLGVPEEEMIDILKKAGDDVVNTLTSLK